MIILWNIKEHYSTQTNSKYTEKSLKRARNYIALPKYLQYLIIRKESNCNDKCAFMHFTYITKYYLDITHYYNRLCLNVLICYAKRGFYVFHITVPQPH